MGKHVPNHQPVCIGTTLYLLYVLFRPRSSLSKVTESAAGTLSTLGLAVDPEVGVGRKHGPPHMGPH